MSKRLEEVRNLAEGLVEIQVEFIERDTCRKQGLIFYTYESLIRKLQKLLITH